MKLIKLLTSFIAKTFVDFGTVIASPEGVKSLYRVSFYRNAGYLMLSSGILVPLGFAFWIIAARLYSPEDIGLASAAISAVSLLGTVATFGLGYGFIRFLAQSGKDANIIINSCFTIGGLASLTTAFIFLGGLSFWSPALLSIRDNLVYATVFILFTIAYTLSILTEQAFIARRQAGFVLARGLIFNLLKLPLPILLATFFHSFGIFSSWGISLGVALLFSILLFLPRAQPGYRPSFSVKIKVLNDILHFSFANYLSSLFWGAPGLILPLLVVNLLGAEVNAYFYIAWSVASMLIMFPTAASTSLFAEGSSEEESLGLNVRRSLRMVFLILVPAMVLVLIFADKLLLLFGSSYSENGTTLLRLLAISTLPVAINVIYLGIKRVEKRLKVIIGLTVFMAAVTLVLAYLLLPWMGINGAGIAWLTSQSIIALIIGIGWFVRRPVIEENPNIAKKEG